MTFCRWSTKTLRKRLSLPLFDRSDVDTLVLTSETIAQRGAHFKGQLREHTNHRHDGYLSRPCTDSRRRNQAIRSLPSWVIASSTKKTVREGKTTNQVRIGICLGRARSRYAKVDRWQVLECKQSLRKLLDIPRDGGQAWRWTVCTAASEKNWREDARQRKRQ